MFAVGTTLMLDYGEFEDRQIVGPFRILKQFDGDTAKQEFLVQWKPVFGGRLDPNDPEGAFITWLQDNGYIATIAAEAWCIDMPKVPIGNSG